MATKKALTAIAKTFNCASLLSSNSDAKTIKGVKYGFETGILYMMPDAKLCPMAKLAGCESACLVSAGRAAFTPGIGIARAGRTAFFHANREAFMELLLKDIQAVVNKAAKHGTTPAIRLNGTSDVNWSTIKHEGKTVFEHFPEVQFYDYTKSPSIVRSAAKIANWHVTASYSLASDKYANLTMESANKHGANVAVVFRTKNLPEWYLGRRVVDGDKSDLRFLDEDNVVVGLKAKGQAKKDDSGFVVDADNMIAVA